jgi:uncharacterized membrane protein YdjX (TVP38/TMEM64 family)
MLGKTMPTDPGNEDSGESPQYALRQDEEIGESSAATKISRGIGIALIVIAGLAIVVIVSNFGSSSDEIEKAAQAGPFGSFVAMIVRFAFLIIAATLIIVVTPIVMGIFGVGLIASTKSDNPKKRSTVAKIVRAFGRFQPSASYLSIG